MALDGAWWKWGLRGARDQRVSGKLGRDAKHSSQGTTVEDVMAILAQSLRHLDFSRNSLGSAAVSSQRGPSPLASC